MDGWTGGIQKNADVAGKATSSKVSWKKVTQISILFDKGSHTVKTPSFLEKIRVSDAATTGRKFLSKVVRKQTWPSARQCLSPSFSHPLPFPPLSKLKTIFKTSALFPED